MSFDGGEKRGAFFRIVPIKKRGLSPFKSGNSAGFKNWINSANTKYMATITKTNSAPKTENIVGNPAKGIEIQPPQSSAPAPTAPPVDIKSAMAALKAQLAALEASEIAPKQARYAAIGDEIAKLETERETLEAELATLGAPVKTGRGRPPMSPEEKALAAQKRADKAKADADAAVQAAAAKRAGLADGNGNTIANTESAVNGAQA
jgi:hypothetical protein